MILQILLYMQERPEEVFAKYSIDERRKLLYKMLNFVNRCPVSYLTVVVDRWNPISCPKLPAPKESSGNSDFPNISLTGSPDSDLSGQAP
jgi:hypothetical protein